MTPGAMDSGHEAIGFNVFPIRIWSCFALIVPFYAPNPPFGMKMLTQYHHIWEYKTYILE
jgi:hypothetical protein